MDGPKTIARSISAGRIPDKYGNLWQYHSRSDRHSKVACWMIAFELMQTCELLREHVKSGKVVLGVNHTLRDFQTQRKKDLDLVIAQPAGPIPEDPKRTFASLAEHFGVVLTKPQQNALAALPHAPEAPVGSVLVALEAKACMTAHVRALPRLHDELDSSHQTTHGNSERALSVGFVMVNAGETFRSPDMNKFDLTKTPANVNHHRQPGDAIRVIGKITEIRRRSGASSSGFDAIGVMVVDFANDGSPMKLLDTPDPVFPYSQMVQRVAHEYAAAFSRL
jgi:ribosomal protein L30E